VLKVYGRGSVDSKAQQLRAAVVSVRIRQLGTEGVQFATFPETIVPYYRYFSFIQIRCTIFAPVPSRLYSTGLSWTAAALTTLICISWAIHWTSGGTRNRRVPLLTDGSAARVSAWNGWYETPPAVRC
jgi:hypothetical protein